MRKKIAIIGTGFFGVTLALTIAKKHQVDLFEKKKTILNGASKANQMRFHQGYHYPRSIKTLKEVKKFNQSFIEYYGKNVLGNTNNYYAISKKNSKTTYDKFINFLNQNSLFYKEIQNKDFSNKVSSPIISEEKNLDYFKIKKKIINKIKISKNIKLHLGRELKKREYYNYDKVIIACYEQNNNVLKKLGIKPKKKYKYELVEKIVIKLPKRFKKDSFMVLDGKFVSLDPYLGTKFHLLSDVKFSKIEIMNSIYPNFKSSKKKYINKGLIKNIKISRFQDFINNSSKYLPFLKEAKYIGSFFVVRTIEINKEKTDERLNQICKINDKIFTILSGKWNTSVGLANTLSKMV
jgi:hypothetical protein